MTRVRSPCSWRRRVGSSPPIKSPIKMTLADDPVTFEATNYSATQNQNSVVDTPTRIHPGTRTRLEKYCPNCEEWVGLGGKGSPYSFILHQGGERCRRATELKALVRAEDALQPLVASTSFGPKPLPMRATPPVSTRPHIPTSEPTLDHHPPGPYEFSSVRPIFPHSGTPMAIASPPSSPLPFLPSLVLPEQTSRVSPTTPDAMVLDMLRVPPPSPSIPASLPPVAPLLEQTLPVTTYPGFPIMTKVPCHGVRLKWECGRSSKTYPFQYHDTDSPTWSVMTRRPPDPDVIYLQSFSCALFHNASTEACFECLKVPSSDKFQSLVLKASKDPAPTVPWGYLSWEQISKRLKDRTDECRRYRKKVGPAFPLPADSALTF